MEALDTSAQLTAPSGLAVCSACGQQAQPSDRFCRYCGGAREANASSSRPTDLDPSLLPPPMRPSGERDYAAPAAHTPPPGPPVYASPPAAPPSATNGMSVASLVLGILWLWGVGSLLALTFGVMGKNQIDRSDGRQSGRGMAIAGIVLGIVGLAGAVILILLIAGALSASS
jgi:ribosomal protein L32